MQVTDVALQHITVGTVLYRDQFLPCIVRFTKKMIFLCTVCLGEYLEYVKQEKAAAEWFSKGQTNVCQGQEASNSERKYSP